MKKNLFKTSLILLLITTFYSCTSEDDNPINSIKLVKVLTHTNSSGVSRNLNITYNNSNNIKRIDSESYYKLYTYSGENISKIESITLPNTPYYTIEFTYLNGRVVNTKRTNHYNSSVMYVDYSYSSDGRINRICLYDSDQEKNDGLCEKSYQIEYAGATTNYLEKTFLRDVGLTLFETKTKWEYDSNTRPFFGQAINTISIPYATNGLEVDWEIVYSLNNPTKRTQKDNNTGVYNLSKTYNYLYDKDGSPIMMETKKYDLTNGNLLSTFKSEIKY